MNILLINQYAGNKGDRAVLYAMCRLLKSKYPHSNITVSTSNPKLWDGYQFYETENIKFIPSAWDYNTVINHKTYWKYLNKYQKYTFTLMRESFLRGINLNKLFVNPLFNKALKKSDVVISVGGHHFTTILSTDLVSSINFDAMAVASCKKLICFSQSFGPFKFRNPRNEKLTKKILSRSILMPRENQALHELESFMCGIEHSKIIPTYESVLTLSNRIEYKTIQHRDNAIGISIYSTQLHTKKKEEIESYLSTIASFCNQAINDGYSIRFFPMELKGSEPDDRPYIKRIISAITEKSKCFMYDNDMETLQHLQEVSKCKIFLGHKTHSTIFALATGTPLIALAYHPKTIEFLKQFGLSANALDDSKLTSEALISIYRNISSNLELISRSEYSKSLELSDRIDADLEIAFKEII